MINLANMWHEYGNKGLVVFVFQLLNNIEFSKELEYE